YNAYWRRTLRSIENGTYARILSKLGRKAAQSGEAVPEEILAAMPKRMREQVVRDREIALAQAKRQNKPGATGAGAGARGDFDKEESTQEDLVLDGDGGMTQPMDPVFDAPAVIKSTRPIHRTQSGSLLLDEMDEFDLDSFLSKAAEEEAEAEIAAARGTQPVPVRASPTGSGIPRPPAAPVGPPRPSTGSGLPPPPGVRPPASPQRPSSSFGAVAAPTDQTQPMPVPGRLPTAAPRPSTGSGLPPPTPTAGRQNANIFSTGNAPPPSSRDATAPISPAALRDARAQTPASGLPISPSPVQRAPGVPPVPSKPAAPPPPIPKAASQVTRPNPIRPGSSEQRAVVAPPTVGGRASTEPPIDRDTHVGPAPTAQIPVVPAARPDPTRPIHRRPDMPTGAPPRAPIAPIAKPAQRPPPGMSDADVDALYSKYVKAKGLVGEETGPQTREKLLKTINAQAPKIMEQYKAKGVDFSIVVKDNQVIIRAKPKP
ncbi:MAG TPA: MXAN_5187 C-terminal domain-containing protein, partial [Solirubrobacteraceae bacterium]|nr:MXAN_5187 C-terminal domain-containing protein [Solirubrobacteraceae bacterium]